MLEHLVYPAVLGIGAALELSQATSELCSEVVVRSVRDERQCSAAQVIIRPVETISRKD